MSGRARVSGRTLIAIFGLTTILSIALVAYSFQVLNRDTDSTLMVGSMFVSDAGRAQPGPHYSATYNATLLAVNGSGMLNLTLINGTGDALSVHAYTVSNLVINTSSASFSLDGHPVMLAWVQNDTVWNGNFSLYYIASWGPNAPQGEIKGTISPALFPGLPSTYYVELRLMPTQPPQTPDF